LHIIGVNKKTSSDLLKTVVEFLMTKKEKRKKKNEVKTTVEARFILCTVINMKRSNIKHSKELTQLRYILSKGNIVLSQF